MDKKKFEDYDGFVEKFKPKKTTDDCYTPPYIYDAVLSWAAKHFEIEGRLIFRPFYPGRDYQKEEYPENCIVIDNPPFSILADIRRFYMARGIEYILFSPHLTLFSADIEDTHIVSHNLIEYENGAKVLTSFVANLKSLESSRILVSPSLHQAIENAQERVKARKKEANKKPGYKYPKELITVSSLATIANYGGTDIVIPRTVLRRVKELESQRVFGKKIFGEGFLISDKYAKRIEQERERIKQEREEQREREKIVFELSERERKIIEELNNHEK